MEGVATKQEETLAEERQRISKMCYNGDGITSESIIHEAIEPPIDFIDLYAYHDQALNYRAEEFQKSNPKAKIIHVGLEFEHSGRREGLQSKVHSNEFLINYDALSFVKRLKKESVSFINIDFTGLGPKILPLMEEAARVLRKNGQFSFYITIDLELDTINQLHTLGFSSARRMKIEQYDFLDRRPYENDGQKIRILATK
jgi:hypothetical protein